MHNDLGMQYKVNILPDLPSLNIPAYPTFLSYKHSKKEGPFDPSLPPLIYGLRRQ